MMQPMRRRSLADEIYDQLRRMIVTLDLKPGETLVEKELCDRFSVSRTPVREAILRLADHGMVEIAPQHATFVSGIDVRAVRQAHFLRSNLEIPLIRQLCATPGLDLSRPRAILVEQQVLMEDADFASFMPLDDLFHQSLFELGGLREIWSVIHSRKAQLDRIRFLQAPQGGKVPILVQDHKDMLEAIAEQDAVAGEAMLRRHVAGAVIFMEKQLLLDPEAFQARPRRIEIAGQRAG